MTIRQDGKSNSAAKLEFIRIENHMNNPRYNNLQIHFGTQREQKPIGLIRKSYAFKPLSLSLHHSEWVQVTEQNSLSAVRARIVIQFWSRGCPVWISSTQKCSSTNIE